MNMLTKDSSKRANCGSQKDIEYISNVITDIDFLTANNWIGNSVTDMANQLFRKTMCYMNNKHYHLALNK